MNQEQWNAMDNYLTSRLLPQDAALDAALEASAAAGLPSINVAPNQGKLLHLLAKLRGARRILEVGTLGAYSTIWLARALPPDGRLISLEANPGNAEVARANVQRAGLSGVVSIVIGAAAQTLDKFVTDGVEPFDMIFLDADKKNYPDYLRLSVQLSRPGTLIVGDNVIRAGRIADAANTDPDVIGLHEFFRLLAMNPRLDSTAIQTVGSKGWDGFSMTLVSS
ncbi:O-methyltransferase [Paraburkholderia fynbosensis]|uniref:Catechol O-methyltransferase n=1 Tax=Paraburkholderia fynbosensis TaxID=1200993 RepID=A0A6J5FQY6_9BURK|nr:O-methyltransferase [Paraburkholderia fynbosensis]CAB3785251.1 Catechol O-methyltransferase [Paraburkholderia fynbosensis]